jgi:RNA 3'-terminal phosphate cyclase (GTP)
VEIIDIDGTFGEGGGSIFRLALAFAIISKKGVKITKIRGKRSNPGLRAQHLSAFKILKLITSANTTDAKVGTNYVEFLPTGLKGGQFKCNIGTAGSITLVIQALLPIPLIAKNNFVVEITGGTDVAWSPSWDYLINVTLKLLEMHGYHAETKLVRRGFFPKGGGQVKINFFPVSEFSSIKIDSRGKVKDISGISVSANLPSHIVKRQAISAETVLKEHGLPATIHCVNTKAYCPGSSITLWASTENSIIGSCALGKRGKPAEQVGKEAANQLIKELDTDAGVDRYLGDQLIPFMALKPGSFITVPEITKHTSTNIWLAEKFFDVKFSIEECDRYFIIKTKE